MIDATAMLIDSNAISHYLSGKLPVTATDFINAIVDEGPLISVITQIELLGFNAPQSDAILFQEFVSESKILGLSDSIINQTIALRKARRIKLPDAIIAATALVHGLTLLTNNTKDFTTIPGLLLIDPHTL